MLKKKSTLFFTFTIIMAVIELIFALEGIHTEVILIYLIIALYSLGYKIRRLKRMEFGLVVTHFMYLALIFLYSFIGVSTAGLSTLGGYLAWGVISLLSICFYKFLNDSQQQFLLFTILFVTIGNTIYISLVGYRYIGDWSMHNELISNASYSSMIMLFSGVLFIWMINENNHYLKIVLIAFFVICLYANIIILQRGTNFVLTTIMISLVLLTNKNRKKSSISIAIVLILFSVLVLSGLLERIMLFLISHMDHRLGKKLSQILIYLQTGDIDLAHGFSGRSYLLQNSINTWTSSPIRFLLGAGDHRGGNTIIGNHSDIIDNFARYGLFGGLNVIAMFYFQKKCSVDSNLVNSSVYIRQMGIVYLIYFSRAVLGATMTGDIAIQMSLFIPLVIVRLNNQNRSIKV